ncbi:pistil-specific extensin-like protein [Thalassophryne amazonica]|uniref:pistil-specific extensin-like protein n=1 Tax=Thalassophryne amazonica TaxID=390379 RepID=UPI001471F119|nr:pistil-specific extensin-like protein [Thalassophryne amazonica]
MCDPYVDTTLEDWFQRYLDQESSPPAPPEEAQDLYDSFIPDFVCPEDTDGPLEVPPDSPLLPTYSVPPVVPPYTDAPPTCEAPPPNPPLPPSFIPTITDTPPTCEAPPPNPPLPPSFIPTITDAPPPVRPRTPSPPRPHIKKPPNSFMLFRQEQRPLVAAQNNITDCAAINKILGQMVSVVCTLLHVHNLVVVSVLTNGVFSSVCSGNHFLKSKKKNIADSRKS